MKLAIARSTYRLDGGAEKQTEKYIQACLNLGYEVTLVCNSWNISLQNDAFKVIRVDNKDRFYSAVAAILDTHPFDHVIGMEPIKGANILRLGDGIHRDWIDIKNQNRPLHALFDRYISRKHRMKLVEQETSLTDEATDQIIVNSEFIYHSIKKRWPGLVDKIRLVRNVVEHVDQSQTRQPSPERNRFVFIGSGWRRKGLDRAIKLIATDPYAELEIFGVDKNKSQFERLSEDLKVTNRIHFMGVTNQIHQQLGRFLCMLSPSYYEPFPNAGAESLAAGCPVITSITSGLSDWGEDRGIFILGNDEWDDPPIGLLTKLIESIPTDLNVRSRYRDKIEQYNLKYLERELSELLL